MGQLSELHGRLLRLKLEARVLAGEIDPSADESLHTRGADESKTLAEAAENLWRILDALHGKANFNPNQPRVPAGNPEGGQWTDAGGSGGGSSNAHGGEDAQPRAQASFIDRMNDQAYERLNNILEAAGHHLVPVAIISKLPFKPETAKVLMGGTTGRHVPPKHGYSKEHRLYNAEAEKETLKFAQARGKRIEDLTPDDGRDLLKEMWRSRNPIIREFNLKLVRQQIIRRLLRRIR